MEPTIAPQRSYKFLTVVIVIVLILVFTWMLRGGSSTEIAPAVDTVVETVATTTAQ